jgi:2-methylcitrate dehydratase PrpD
VGKTHYQIFHNTATVGVFGAAAAAARFLDLSEDQMVSALGHAGTLAAGLWQFSKETRPKDSKPVHIGNAARNGLECALLAQHGVRGAEDILEGEECGFFKAFCNPADADMSRIVAEKQGWELAHTSMKPWPSCRHTHAPIDAALALSAKSNVKSVEIETYQAALDLCNRPAVNSKFDAQFSLQHCVRAALLDGKIDLESFEEASYRRPGPQVTVKVTPEFENAYPELWGAKVSINGGEKVEIRKSALGDPERPLSMEQVLEKARILGELEAVQQLQNLKTV